VAAFGLFYLAERVFHLDRAHAQTLMYLKLSVAGHLTIFLTRTRGPIWSIRPARILWIAVLGTQIVATLIAVYGLFMTPLGWGWAGFVWVYALAWFLINDRVKLLAYKIFDPMKADSKSETKTDAKPEATAQAKPEARTDVKPEVKADAKPEVTAPSDLTPEIAKRAYELYEGRARKDGRADQDWEKAEQEIRKPETKAEPKAEAKTEAKPEATTEPKPEAVVKSTTETKTEAKPEAKAEPIAEGKDKSPSDLTPQLVKRVHELYEDLGRKEVREVEEWEKANRKTSQR